MSSHHLDLDVLIPTIDRAAALALTLSGLAAQASPPRRVIIADQSKLPVLREPLVTAVSRILSAHGTAVHVKRNLPRRGLAHQRHVLLQEAKAPVVLFLDDDVWLDPHALSTLADALPALRCGFVGYAVQGLSYLDDVRPAEQRRYEEWSGDVRPERVRRGDAQWERHVVHNAANLVHLSAGLDIPPRGWRAYKIAWIGGCVLYDRDCLNAVGGFGFWRRVPVDHSGEDVAAQLQVMERFGGVGLVPSRAYHLELPTTVPNRGTDCYDYVIANRPA